jgi:hypothetical protein
MKIEQTEGHFLTCGSDFFVCLWSPGLDLWGTINLLTEKMDDKWFFPESMYFQKRNSDLTKMMEVM